MKIIRACVVLSLVADAMLAAGTVKRPAALLGDTENVQGLRCDVLAGGRVRSVVVPCEKGLTPDAYGDYAVVYFGGSLKGLPEASRWTAPARLAAVSNYVAHGGVIVISGGAVQELAAGVPSLVGFARTRPTAEPLVRCAGEDKPQLWNFDKWNNRDTFAGEGLADGTVCVASFVDGAGAAVGAAVTRRPLGKGAVWWISPQVSKLRMRMTWGGFNLGNADEQGNVQPTAEGEALAALSALYLKAFKSAAALDDEMPPSGWGLKPLGKPGDLTFDTTFANRPVFRPPPVRTPAFAFRSREVAGVVVTPRGDTALGELADELAWHLGQMCGQTVPVVSEAPSGVPAVVFEKIDETAYSKGTAVICTTANRIFLGGTGFWGPGSASTYLMEALGIRYLWPGKSGKVIPRRDEIVIPKIDLVSTPAFRHREIRMYDPSAKSRSEALEWLGIDSAAFARALAAAECDRPGNRSFTRWHGCARGKPEIVPDDFDGEWRWGHYFDGYYQRYSKDHPDWFALQPTGVREQDLGNWPERCTLCLSSEGLAEKTAEDLIGRFRASSRFEALSICLPDGGFPAPCMCAACRALDPANAPSTPVYFWKVFNRSFPYVSFTDRVMTFNNRVAERVAKACRGKMLTCYVYSNYVDPPVAVKPHPSLVLLSVAGEYADSGQREWARKNLAAWSRMGNPILWRPNAAMGFKSPVPQNFARRIFDDLETFKANNVIGTDMDCLSRQWTNLGLVFYMIAKAQLNPDALSYETLLDDYCRSAFGAAADDVHAYFAALEKLTDAAAETHQRIRGYVKLFDGDALDAILDRAVRKAQGDDEVLARLAFLRRGVATGRWEKRLAEAEKAAPDVRKALKDAYLDFVRKTAFEDPVAFSPVYVGQSFYRSPFLR